MNKSVLISIQPYWVFLIIARLMGWNIPQEKTVEVRKDFPKASDWNKVAHIYCSKNRKSFNRIPKQYQPSIVKFLGKVIGDFVGDRISKYNTNCLDGEDSLKAATCLDDAEIMDYVGYLDKSFYLWHITDLKIYDKPKELGEFRKWCDSKKDCSKCSCEIREELPFDYKGVGCDRTLTRPPQSWYYVENLD